MASGLFQRWQLLPAALTGSFRSSEPTPAEILRPQRVSICIMYVLGTYSSSVTYAWALTTDQSHNPRRPRQKAQSQTLKLGSWPPKAPTGGANHFPHVPARVVPFLSNNAKLRLWPEPFGPARLHSRNPLTTRTALDPLFLLLFCHPPQCLFLAARPHYVVTSRLPSLLLCLFSCASLCLSSGASNLALPVPFTPTTPPTAAAASQSPPLCSQTRRA